MEGSLVAYKVFTNGSVLNASEVNDNLMNQAVITFTNSAARASAITSPVEGMVTYLADTDTYEFWNGSAWSALVSSTVGSGNAIINGAFEINQRGYASAGTLASGAYGFDRWKANAADTTLTFTSAPQGQQITINDTKGIKQIIERANLPAGTYTLSFSGTATGRIYNTGATPPSYAASPITVTLDGLANVEVEFTASGGAKTLSNVQLEAGSTATPFRRNANSRQGELAACQRYYQKVGIASAYGIGFGFATSTTNARVTLPLACSMRATPTIEDDGAIIRHQGTGYNISAFASIVTSPGASVAINATTVALMTVNQLAVLSSDANFALSSEL